MIRKYYQLTKPGIIYGNLLTAAGGFLLASKGVIDWSLMVTVLAGTSLVIGGACALNNYIDRDIDTRMARTKNRALAAGTIPAAHAIGFGAFLATVGFVILALGTNITTVLVGMIGFIDYLVLYSIWKRRSWLGTVVGSIAGATPVVAGYTAVTGSFDQAAVILFLILASWQMPHFYAIATFRRADYAAAGLPVLPVKKGVMAAKVQILFFILMFLATCGLLGIFGYTGLVYAIIMSLLGLSWLLLALQGFKTKNDTMWARRMFKRSLIVLLGFSLAISLDAWLW